YYQIYKENSAQTLDRVQAIETIEELKLKNPDYTIKEVNFNSDASDFGAVKFNDSVYFTSDRDKNKLFGKTYKWTHQPFLDIYAVRVNEKNATLGRIQALPKQINSKLHEGNFRF